MAERYLKNSSIFIREMQIKTSLRYHLMTVKMNRINTTDDSLCWRGCGVSGTLLHCWYECKYVQPLWKLVGQFLRKLRISLPQDPGIPILVIYPKDEQSYPKDTCSAMFIETLFVIARAWKQPRCS